jgi:hypothetical protein
MEHNEGMEDFEPGIIDKGIKRWMRNQAMPHFRMQMEDPAQARPDTFDSPDNCQAYDNQHSKSDYKQLEYTVHAANTQVLNDFESYFRWLWCTEISRYCQRSAMALGLPVLESLVVSINQRLGLREVKCAGTGTRLKPHQRQHWKLVASKGPFLDNCNLVMLQGPVKPGASGPAGICVMEHYNSVENRHMLSFMFFPQDKANEQHIFQLLISAADPHLTMLNSLLPLQFQDLAMFMHCAVQIRPCRVDLGQHLSNAFWRELISDSPAQKLPDDGAKQFYAAHGYSLAYANSSNTILVFFAPPSCYLLHRTTQEH